MNGQATTSEDMTVIRHFQEITQLDGDDVGGKGLSLGLLTRAGLPVPPGFCITSTAYRQANGRFLQANGNLAEQIRAAYRNLGAGQVAVRSSATAEDGAVTSFAGQQETVLGVGGEEAVLAAVARCWDSLGSERSAAYRRKQGVGESGLAMAVVVQRLVPAEVSGVLFTRDPLDPAGRKMLVEASWGLGESVVAGKVTPDRFHLDRETGQVLDRHIGTKATMVTASGPAPVPAEKQAQSCLDEAQLCALAALARHVEAFYGDARDVEWAWSEGRFWLLQARPITAGGYAEREQVRREEIEALRARAEPSGTVWSRYNLSEILPEPTPMTWSIVRRFMSGCGGFGLMYRDLGFDPDRSLDEEGVFDLVCGRPYCNLSREPRLVFRQLPFEHPFAVLKAAPHKALYPKPVLNPSRAGWRFWLKLPILLPVLFWKMMRSETRVRRLGRTLPERLREELLPAFAAETQRQAAQDPAKLDTPVLLERLHYWITRTLYDFARDSLKPTALAGVALKNIENALVPSLGQERATAALGELSLGVRPDAAADLPFAVNELTGGQLDRAAFLERFGHRANQEMELAHPRWAEDHAALDRLVAAGRPGENTVESHLVAATGTAEFPPAWFHIATEAKLTDSEKAALETELALLHTHLALRETAKHYFMMGYALIRRFLVELDRRHDLNGGIFYLTLEELPDLAAGKDLSATIAQRRRRRTLALSLEVPQVLFSDDLEAIGRPAPLEGADTLQGVPLSAGVAEAPALVLHEPENSAIPAQPYILVCPSTDPAWVPLFVHARGLVMETGGVLSHGAIVAREFGLPAVAGLPEILRRVQTGQRLRVDGGAGTVSVLAE
jgi:pyruvate,water dikinase